ncbi:MAG: DUF975 family protein [Patescibacteria group bacterium]|jgi:uncharacterized membrane protein
METKQVAIGQAFSYGWTELKKNFWYFVGLAVIVIIIEGIGSGPKDGRAYFNFLGIFLSAWMTSGYTKIILDYYGGTKRELTDVFTQFAYFWRVLGASILIGLIVMLGFIALIIPGIYFGLRFMFTVPLIIDKNLDIGEAMKQSTELTKGIKGSLFLFALGMIGAMILGAICLGVGVFIAMPVVWLAFIYIYKNLQPSAVPAASAPTGTVKQ